MNFYSIGGRRFTFAVGLTLLSAALLWFGKLNSSDFTSIVNFNVIALVAGHTADNFAKGKRNADTTA
jgi:hypothetical protein